MAYQVLARKCRPQDFASLIGQESIVTALTNALTDERIAQAYLFSGIRGVGKTSAARVLAKALNCEQGPTAEPCNQCLACREITAGADLDVLEVDAATYSKVEQVRELTESLRYGPARDRYKVVILDEVHRLSRQAFDALLKIIEEPPEHLVFIFATTEIEAVPATILSRCQEFNFRRVPAAILTQHLANIAASENIEASEAALRLIARAGEGSVRDSVALLDQLATFGGSTISDDNAVSLLGGLDLNLFHDLLAAMLGGDSASVAAIVRRLEVDGRDPRNVYKQFLGYCRDALHLSLGGDPEQLELPQDDARRLAELCHEVAYENLLRLTHQLLASEASVRRSEAGVLALEIAWLRAAELPKLMRVEELLGGAAVHRARTSSQAERSEAPPARSTEQISKPAAARPMPPTPAPTAEPTPARSAEPAASASKESKPEVSKPEVSEPLPEPSAEASTPAASEAEHSPGSSEIDPAGAIERFVHTVCTKKQPLGVRLQAAEGLRLENGTLIITLADGAASLARALERSTNRRVLEDALEAEWGPGLAWKIEEVEAPEAPAAEAERDEAEAEVETDPRVQAVLDIFGGRIDGVEPKKEGSR